MTDTRDTPGEPETRFLIDVSTPTIEVEIRDVWPDGDAPKNPTAADVVAVMRECGSMRTIIRDWCFDLDMAIEVSVLGNPRDFAEYR